MVKEPMPVPSSNHSYAVGAGTWVEPEAGLTPTLDRWQYDIIRPFMGRKLLEAGAGTGRIAAQVAADNEHEELVAIEPSPQYFPLLKSACRNAPRTKLLEVTAARLLPGYREHFDTVYSVHVLENVKEDRQLLETMLSLTRPGGDVIVMVPALPFLYSDQDRQVGHLRRYSKGMIGELTRDLGVVIRHISYSNIFGIPGALYFSKIRRINCLESSLQRERYLKSYRFFSERLVPLIRQAERYLPVPIGLNLAAVIHKPEQAVARS